MKLSQCAQSKKGTYTVVVKFITTKDAVVSDVTPVTNYGYGMEEEVMGGGNQKISGMDAGATKQQTCF